MQKTAIIAAAVVGALTAGYYILGRHPIQPVPADALKNVYNQWKVDYKINVGASEDEYRYKVFSNNYDQIVASNLEGKSYTLGLNSFTHLTQEEFSATHLGLLASPEPRDTVKLPLKNLKANIDWAPKLNPVKNQGHCGSCWAFSAVGALEGLFNIANDNKLNLSEQNLVDCAGDFGNHGCSGGLAYQAFQYVISVGGIASQEEYPYTGADGQCKTDVERIGKISSFVSVAVNNSDALKAALTNQPCAVSIEADTIVFQSYKNGVITDDACGTNLDHAVLAVGYNDEDATPYYKVRNSWGPSWGEDGHVRIGISDGEGVCGIQKRPSYPVA